MKKQIGGSQVKITIYLIALGSHWWKGNKSATRVAVGSFFPFKHEETANAHSYKFYSLSQKQITESHLYSDSYIQTVDFCVSFPASIL